jgi:ring-1,2-phenylacetyl-CoA epoxidase subunit PaaE
MPPQGRFFVPLVRRRAPARARRRRRQWHHPILSIVKTVLARAGSARHAAVRQPRAASTMFKEEIEDLKNRHMTRLVLHPVFSRRATDSPLHMRPCWTATSSASSCAAGEPGPRIDQAFVCGPHS